MSEQQDAESPQTEALMKIIEQRYGDRVGPKQLEQIRSGVDTMAKAAEKLRSVPIENGDEPFSVFVPYRGED